MNRLAELDQAEQQRYDRQIMLPEVGEEGQRRLMSASALIVGLGGLGSPIALYLAAAGIGRLGLVDDDVVDETNLQRQVIHGSTWLGRLKVESARERVLELNPNIQVDIHATRFSLENGAELLRDHDMIIDGVDNLETRYTMNDLAVQAGKPYIYGSIFRFEGQVSVLDARIGPCYRCLFSDPPPEGRVPASRESGVLGVVPGAVGCLQATEALKLILGIGTPLVGKLLVYNCLDMSVEILPISKDPNCPVCGTRPALDKE